MWIKSLIVSSQIRKFCSSLSLFTQQKWVPISPHGHIPYWSAVSTITLVEKIDGNLLDSYHLYCPGYIHDTRRSGCETLCNVIAFSLTTSKSLRVVFPMPLTKASKMSTTQRLIKLNNSCWTHPCFNELVITLEATMIAWFHNFW